MKKLLFLLLFLLLPLNCMAEDNFYVVIGTNTFSRETVTGKLRENVDSHVLSGFVIDNERYVFVNGEWAGKGLAEVYSSESQYILEVVEDEEI